MLNADVWPILDGQPGRNVARRSAGSLLFDSVPGDKCRHGPGSSAS